VQNVWNPGSFQPVSVAHAATGDGKGKLEPFRFAYISDSHLYARDVNALDPQPDFVLYGGDLAQLGQAKELDLGAQILKNLKAPLRMMVGEHDW